ncbi:MAG TPA: threonine-phosphate decarboxylase CobD [Methanothrix sp.]|nr:threonine-phosphate decarboxylase CobD [Methanothrix sp.]HPT19273.1 threonine-phosphate decarboxylase CobD [Methanothrix sp.]
MIKQIRKSFAGAAACQHGGKIHEAASILGVEPLDFSANINPLGCPPLEKLVLEELEKIGHYPDYSYLDFRRAAGKFVAVSAECIVPGNGSSELIRLFAECCFEEGDLGLVPTPSFGEYANQSLLAGAAVKRVKIGGDGMPLLEERDLKNAKLLFICNPNNPTGRLLSKDQIIDLADRCEKTGTFLLVDEAFIELSSPEESVAAYAPKREHLFVMRSLTKSFGVPGLRLGFGVTNEKLAGILNLARIPWSIGSIAAAAAAYLLSCEEHLERSRHFIREELAWLQPALQGLGLAPTPSSVNFILVNIEPTGLASDVLAKRTMSQGVLVRDCQSFGLGKSYIRVAVRSRNENEQLIAALEKALSCRD